VHKARRRGKDQRKGFAETDYAKLFDAADQQRSDAPGAEVVAEAITATLRQFGVHGCACRMAQEFGDHPEAAAERMRWIGQLAAEVPAWPPRLAATGRTGSSAGTGI
jgi:hypothetical protein